MILIIYLFYPFLFKVQMVYKQHPILNNMLHIINLINKKLFKIYIIVIMMIILLI